MEDNIRVTLGILIVILIVLSLSNATNIYTFVHDKVKKYLVLFYLKKILHLDKSCLNSQAYSVAIKTEKFKNGRITILGSILSYAGILMVLWTFIVPPVDLRPTINFKDKEINIPQERYSLYMRCLIGSSFFTIPGLFFLSIQEQNSIKKHYMLFIENQSGNVNRVRKISFFKENIAHEIKDKILGVDRPII